MTISAGSSAGVEPRFFGPRINRRLLGRLADRAVTAGPRELVPVEMPATGNVLGHVPQGTADDVAAVADTACTAQRSWRRLPAAERSKVLLRFALGRDIASRLEAGTVNVNEAYAAAWGSVDAPMGGWKDSGVGSRHGEHGILKYTNAQTVSIQRLLPIAPPRFMPPTGYAKAMTAAMRTLQRLPGRK